MESASITALVNPAVHRAVKTAIRLFVNVSIRRIVMNILSVRKGLQVVIYNKGQALLTLALLNIFIKHS